MILALALLVTFATDVPLTAPHASAQGRYTATLTPSSTPMLNDWETWRLQVERTDGGRFAPAEVVVDGGMPSHGHGLPTKPLVRRSDDGDFEVTGLRFHMHGAWQLKVRVLDERGVDSVTFDFSIAPKPKDDDRQADGFSPDQRATLRSLALASLGPPPPDPSNSVADDPRAVALGHRLFFDEKLSRSGKQSCASCHDPARGFSDPRPRTSSSGREAPTLVGLAWSRWFFWDGRRDSLWSQGLVPLEVAGEMNTTRLAVARRVVTTYRAEYTALFGAPPKITTMAPHANPNGDAAARKAWGALTPKEQEDVNRIFANTGKVIAAYERRLAPGIAPFDRFVQALLANEPTDGILEPKARSGLKTFLAEPAQCLRCHNGPLFTNGAFHNIGTGVLDGDTPDFGRMIGIQALLATEFSCQGWVLLLTCDRFQQRVLLR